MRHALLSLLLLATIAGIAGAWMGLRGPAPTLSTQPAPLPFAAHLATWIDRGVPIAAVVDSEGEEYLILVGEDRNGDWSAAVSPGELPEARPQPAAVALGPAER